MIFAVAPFAGAWIEMYLAYVERSAPKSLPSRERGLKFEEDSEGNVTRKVAPFAGAWIEMAIAAKLIEDGRVAPFTGAWIEIAYPAADRVPCRRRSLHGSVD